jgi:hypothetical protein
MKIPSSKYAKKQHGQTDVLRVELMILSEKLVDGVTDGDGFYIDRDRRGAAEMIVGIAKH